MQIPKVCPAVLLADGWIDIEGKATMASKIRATTSAALDCVAHGSSPANGSATATRRRTEGRTGSGHGENEADNNNFDELLFGRMIEPQI